MSDTDKNWQPRLPDHADGAELILFERQRQIHEEGYTLADDDAYEDGQLVAAAACFMAVGVYMDTRPWRLEMGAYALYDQQLRRIMIQGGWPWEISKCKPGNTPERNYQIAGALLAAELDRKKRRQAAEKASA